MRGGRIAFSCASIALCLVVACAPTFGRHPDVATTGNYLIKWAPGPVGTYQWELSSDVGGGSVMTKGHVDVATLTAQGGGSGMVQLSFTVESSTNSQATTPFSYVVEVEVDPRGKIVSNPDGMFFDAPEFYSVMPLLPPHAATVGTSWTDSYKLPNPSFQDTRDFSLNGKYVRDERSGSSREAVFEVRLFATYDETASYESLFGPLPKGAPAKVNVHEQGTESADVTYWYDPVRRLLVKSVAKNTYSGSIDFIDASTSKSINRGPIVGTESVTFTRTT